MEALVLERKDELSLRDFPAVDQAEERLGPRDVRIRLRACELTAPWEPEQLTGAFVQLDVRGVDGRWRRPFSGWLYKERPSLNVVEHPIYDVWLTGCKQDSDVPPPSTASK